MLKIDLTNRLKYERSAQEIGQLIMNIDEGTEVPGLINDDHMSTGTYRISVLMCFLEQFRRADNLQDPLSLDLGVGIGYAVLNIAAQNWRSYGIELSEPHFSTSVKNIARVVSAGYVKEGMAKVAYGSFFPDDFIPLRKAGVKGEDPFAADIEKLVAACTGKRPYKQLGIELPNVDFFYHFQAERRENILHFFSEYARKGAMLGILEVCNDPFVLPTNVQALGMDEGISFYRKTL